MKPGKLYGVGIGPGDPRYLTLRAADVLRSVDVIFTVISQNASSSVSRSVVESLEPRGEIHLQIFSMSRDKAVRAAQVQANADAIITELKAGRDCAFATLGDAMTYSTFGYVLEIIREAIPGVEVRTVFFDPVNSLVSGSMTEQQWIDGIKSASDQMRANIIE